jgi:soluble lytic murein transglycosylase-like protein
MSIAPLTARSAPSVTDAISLASRATGVDFRYLLDTAARESSLNPAAKSANSSATGLFQFIDQTWLATVKAHGPEHGLGAQASLISEDPNGRLSVADPAQRQAILALRTDPQTSALMAAELARDSRDQLQTTLGRSVGNGDLYLAHFLGAREAGRFISQASATPNTVAATSFRDAAAANRGVFYDGSGHARTLAQVTAFLAGQPTPTGAHQQLAQGSPSLPVMPLPSFSAGSETSALSFAQSYGSGPPMPALRLTPQILEILSSLDPLGTNKDETSNTLTAALGR